jgi:hypothetical protein
MVAVWAFGQATLKHDMTNTLSRSLTLALKAGIFALRCSVCIWWAYSMGAPGSFRTHHEAVLYADDLPDRRRMDCLVVHPQEGDLAIARNQNGPGDRGRSYSLHRRSARLEEQLDA